MEKDNKKQSWVLQVEFESLNNAIKKGKKISNTFAITSPNGWKIRVEKDETNAKTNPSNKKPA